MAKDSIHFAVTPEVHNGLRVIFARGMVDGKDFTHYGKPSRSSVVRYAIERAAEVCAMPIAAAPVALPERTGTVDADRLRAAMGTMTPKRVCDAAGLADGASIRNVVNKGAPLRGKLLAWVEQREAEVRT